MKMSFQQDFWDGANELPKRQRDKFIVACVVYHFTGEEPQLTGAPLGLFNTVRDRIDISKNRQKDGKKCNKNVAKMSKKFSKNVDTKQGMTPQEYEYEYEIENKEKISKDIKKKNLFTPPTKEIVSDYAIEQGITLDCERFVDYYTAQGWKLSNGNKMKDWRAACRNWARRSKPKESNDNIDWSKYA